MSAKEETKAADVFLRPDNSSHQPTSTSFNVTVNEIISIATTTTVDHSQKELIFPASTSTAEIVASMADEIGIEANEELYEIIEKSRATWDEFEFGLAGIFNIRIKRSPKREIKYINRKKP